MPSMMRLGIYLFSTETAAYERLNLTRSWRWSETPRIGAKPVTQYLGPDLNAMRLNGVIFPAYKGGLRQMNALALQAKIASQIGNPLLLIDLSGWHFNFWTIRSIGEAKSHFLKDGAPRQIGFDIEIKEYGGVT